MASFCHLGNTPPLMHLFQFILIFLLRLCQGPTCSPLLRGFDSDLSKCWLILFPETPPSRVTNILTTLGTLLAPPPPPQIFPLAPPSICYTGFLGVILPGCMTMVIFSNPHLTLLFPYWVPGCSPVTLPPVSTLNTSTYPLLSKPAPIHILKLLCHWLCRPSSLPRSPCRLDCHSWGSFNNRCKLSTSSPPSESPPPPFQLVQSPLFES